MDKQKFLKGSSVDRPQHYTSTDGQSYSASFILGNNWLRNYRIRGVGELDLQFFSDDNSELGIDVG